MTKELDELKPSEKIKFLQLHEPKKKWQLRVHHTGEMKPYYQKRNTWHEATDDYFKARLFDFKDLDINSITRVAIKEMAE